MSSKPVRQGKNTNTEKERANHLVNDKLEHVQS
jgi:hypothetical protein